MLCRIGYNQVEGNCEHTALFDFRVFDCLLNGIIQFFRSLDHDNSQRGVAHHTRHFVNRAVRTEAPERADQFFWITSNGLHGENVSPSNAIRKKVIFGRYLSDVCLSLLFGLLLSLRSSLS